MFWVFLSERWQSTLFLLFFFLFFSFFFQSRRKLSIQDRGRALAWLGDAVSMTEVARRLQVSHSVIQRLQGWFRATGRVTEQPPSGHPRCTSTQDDRFLYLSTLRDRSITSTMLRRQLMSVVHVNVSPSTIHSRLHETGLHSRRAAVKSPSTPAL